MKKVICLLLALLLPCVALAEYTMAGYDGEDTYRTWSSNLFFARMEEKTGVSFRYVQYTDAAQWKTYKASVKASDSDLPDVFFKAQLTSAECISLLDRGVLIDLAPYIAEYCPNLSALMESDPEIRNAITLPDGRIAALPSISEQPMQNCIWINNVWLKALGLSEPQNAEELTEVLRAFKNRDPNHNGGKDEIPLAFLGSFDLKFLAHAFGLVSNDYNLTCEDGTVVFVPLKKEFRDFVAWLHGLWEEGLLDKNGFSTSDSLRIVSDSSATNVYGAVITTLVANFLPAEWLKDYTALTPLLYQGKRVYRNFAGSVTTGTFAVTSACANVEEMLRWVDSFYTDEVYRLGSAGLEGTDYFVDGDGTWRLSTAVQNNSYFTGETLISSGGVAPGYNPREFQRKFYDGTVSYISDELDKISAVAVRPFPYYSLNAEQAAFVAPLQSKLGRIVDQTIACWVTGQEEISDASFAQFETELNHAGLPEFMTFWQSVLEGATQR